MSGSFTSLSASHSTVSAGDAFTSSSHGLRFSSTMTSYPSSSKQPPLSGIAPAIERSVRLTIALMRVHSSGEASGASGCSRRYCRRLHLHPARMPSLSVAYELEFLLIDELVRCCARTGRDSGSALRSERAARGLRAGRAHRVRVLEVVEVVLLRREPHEAVVVPVDAQRVGGEQQHVQPKVELVAADGERALDVALDDVHLGELDARRHRPVQP